MTYTDEELVPTTSPLQHGTSGRFACSPIEREITRSSWSPGAQHSWSAAQPTPFLVHKSARSASQLYPSDRHRPRSPFMQAMSITKEVIRTTPPGSGRIGSTPTSPSFARMSRVHFWSNLLAQQDIADRGQTKSNSRRSSRGSSSRSSSSWRSMAGSLRSGSSAVLHSFVVYGRQRVMLASLALSVLSGSVLTLGFLMTSYLHWGGLTEAEISVFRGVGALSGLGATAIFPMLAPRLGLHRTGLLGTYYQLTWLTLGLSPLVIVTILQPDKTPHVAGIKLSAQNLQRLLIAGMAISRTGLWTFDLAVTQLMQDLVAPEDLGLVSGVAGSLDSLFFSVSFIAALFVADPGLFYWLMVASWGLTAFAASLYTIFYVRTSSTPEQ
mmetsp:Transcript_26534/g.71777  ORF Transcript_26534/g.71777 Transcript_26534/m.71777 type:complete len:382 (-) Transcript_26534:398-1543(-)